MSVVIPTRNHAPLLEYCIKSCLEQDSDLFELIVSDNASTDDTQDVVQAHLADSRMRHQRADAFMPEIADSWEYARQSARGRYILLIGDDDALVPTCIGTLARVVHQCRPGIMTWRVAPFDYRARSSCDGRSTLGVPTHSGRLVWAPSSWILAGRFQMRHRQVLKPLGANSCYRSDIIDTVVARTGRFYHRPFPDVTSSTLALAVEPRLLFVDIPLTVGGISRGSTVGDLAHTWTSKAREGLSESQCLSECLPQIALFENLWAESFLRAKLAFPAELEPYELDLSAVLVALYGEVRGYCRQGEPVRDLVYALDKYAADLSAPERLSVWSVRVRDDALEKLSRLRLNSRARAGRVIQKSRVGSAVVLARRKSASESRRLSNPSRFGDVLDAARHLSNVQAAPPDDLRAIDADFRRLAGASYHESFELTGQRDLRHIEGSACQGA